MKTTCKLCDTPTTKQQLKTVANSYGTIHLICTDCYDNDLKCAYAGLNKPTIKGE